MASATLPQVLKDHVFVVFDCQRPNCPPAGTHLLPIGFALENVKAGNARIDPRSKNEFDAFLKAQEVAAQKRQQQMAARAKLAKK